MVGRPRRFRVAAAALLVLVAAAATRRLLRPPYYHWAEVRESVLYRSGWLGAEDLREATGRYGIRTVVNLRNERDARYREEEAALRDAGIDLVDVPIDPRRAPSAAQVETLLALFDDPARLPVLVHCRQGAIRAASVEGLWRREYLGESPDAAIRASSRFGRDLEGDAPDIAAFLRSYVPRRLRSPARASHPVAAPARE
jgi:uncharacterized protein (TIGR01244 family)